MSGVGPSELLLVFIIGLLILGPERLPRVAAQLGKWVGRARRTANQLRYQLEREVALADIKKPPGPKNDETKSAGPERNDGSGPQAGAPDAEAGIGATADEASEASSVDDSGATADEASTGSSAGQSGATAAAGSGATTGIPESPVTQTAAGGQERPAPDDNARERDPEPRP